MQTKKGRGRPAGVKQDMNFLQITLNNLGHGKVGKACGVTRQAVKQWWFFGKLPDTEHLSADHPKRTNYAAVIAKMAKCAKADLLRYQ